MKRFVGYLLLALGLSAGDTGAKVLNQFFEAEERHGLEVLMLDFVSKYPPEEYFYLALSEEAAVFAEVLNHAFPGSAAKIPISNVRDLVLKGPLSADWYHSIGQDSDHLREIALAMFPAAKEPEFRESVERALEAAPHGKKVLVFGASVEGIKLLMATEKIRQLFPERSFKGLALDRSGHFVGVKPYYEKISLGLKRYLGADAALSKASSVSELPRWDQLNAPTASWNQGLLSRFHKELLKNWVKAFVAKGAFHRAAATKACGRIVANISRRGPASKASNRP